MTVVYNQEGMEFMCEVMITERTEGRAEGRKEMAREAAYSLFLRDIL